MYIPYVCKDRYGVVHLAYPRFDRRYYHEAEDLVDHTLCGEVNYMAAPPKNAFVTCLMCSGEYDRAQQVIKT